jgi:hypothetical protein
MPARQIGAASRPPRHLVLDTSLTRLNVVIDGIRRGTVCRQRLPARAFIKLRGAPPPLCRQAIAVRPSRAARATSHA